MQAKRVDLVSPNRKRRLQPLPSVARPAGKGRSRCIEEQMASIPNDLGRRGTARLAAGSLVAEIVPSLGGGVARFDVLLTLPSTPLLLCGSCSPISERCPEKWKKHGLQP